MRKLGRALWNSSPETLVRKLKEKLRRETQTKLDRTEIRPTFCLSTGRVGSKTLSSLGSLRLHSASQHEPTPKLFGLGRAAYEGRSVSSLLLAAVECCRESQIQRFADSQGLYIETSPHITFLAPALKALYPHAKFVHVIRNPFSVIRSGMRRGWYDGHAYDRWRISPIAGEVRERWKTMHPFEKNVWLWSETNHWIVEFLSRLPQSDHMVLKSEDMFDGRESSIESFFDFVGVEPPPISKINSHLAQKSNSQLTGQFPKAGDWSTEQLNILADYGGRIMTQFNYSNEFISHGY